MKRVGGLWPRIVSTENLYAAVHAAACGKRLRPDVAAFLLDLEPEALRLRRELAEGTYTPGPYRTFIVDEGKPRLISAAPFRDRVVHHALTRVIEPVFERRFSAASFACRKGMGTHRALAKARLGCRRFRHALKCDVMKYFPSIDHAILKELLRRALKCRRTLGLADAIIDGSNMQEQVIAYFPGDNLFTPFERRRGLPLGNQTSQFFANVYLNGLDHFVARALHPGLYVRYVDDFLLFGDDKRVLRGMRARIEVFLETLRLRMHPGKSRVYRAADGVTFLGFRVFPGCTRLVRRNVVGMRRRMRRWQRDYAKGSMTGRDIERRICAWIGHARHADTWRLRERLFSEYKFSRCVVSPPRSARRFLEQQPEEPAGLESQQERAVESQ